jgi:hypothetical protein
MQERLNMLLKLEEEREKAKMNLTHHQEIIKNGLTNQLWETKIFRRETLFSNGTKLMNLRENTPNSRNCG